MALIELEAGDPPQLGPYRLHGRLGAGGMGVVYLGFDPQGRAAAIKTLWAGANDEARSRFAREAGLLASVRHRRVASFLEADSQADRPWLAMQYISGPSLGDVAVPLASAALRQTALGLAEALAALADKGIVHRDLKPQNVILTYDGPILVDLGIARAVDQTMLTQPGVLIGSPGWIAPEHWRGEPFSPATDVWGWAAVMVFAATGHGPYPAMPGPVVPRRDRHGLHDAIDVPQWLRPLVVAALSDDPHRRPTASAIVDSLEGRPTARTIPRDASATAPTVAITHVLPGPAEQPRRLRASIGAGAVVLAVIVAASVLAMTHPFGADPSSPARANSGTSALALPSGPPSGTQESARTSIVPAVEPGSVPALTPREGARGTELLVPTGWVLQVIDGGGSGSESRWTDPEDPRRWVRVSTGVSLGGWWETDGVAGSVDPSLLLPEQTELVRLSQWVFAYQWPGSQSYALGDTPPAAETRVHGVFVGEHDADGQAVGYRIAEVSLPDADVERAREILNDFLRR